MAGNAVCVADLNHLLLAAYIMLCVLLANDILCTVRT